MKVVPSSTMPTSHALEEIARPFGELATLLPPGWSLDFPLARIRTCGTLTIELLVNLRTSPDGEVQAVYESPDAALLAIKGMSTAILLLALLASQPNGLASKDLLIQTLPSLRSSRAVTQGHLEEDGVLKRLDNVVSLLRTLLSPPKLRSWPGSSKLRKQLVRLVRASPESGPGYQLAAYPLLWLDVAAMETYSAHAQRLDARGEDGLEEWQAVYQIGMRGPFLGHEPYSEWATWRRGRVSDLLWQSVNAQCKRATRWEEGTSGTEAAVALLLAFWQAHIANEDAFGQLIELLGKLERFQQAEECYTQLWDALDQEGRQPQKRTQETMGQMRIRRDRRQISLLVSPQHEASGKGEEERRDTPLGQTLVERPVPETRHLIGREAWLSTVSQMVRGFPAKKLIVLQGPIGVGKSSELTRLAKAFLQAERSASRVVWLPLPAAEWSSGPEATLDVLLATLLNECGMASFPPEAPRERLIAAFLAHLKQQSRPTIMLLDNAECLLTENGSLAPCWEAFLTQFIQSRHQATMLLATKEWHGWPGRESLFVAETFVPPLTMDESSRVLQRLGLESVPIALLQAVSVRLAGIPLLLEWVAKLVADPLLLDDWTGFDRQEALLQASTSQEHLAKRLGRLLDDPSLLGEHLASRLTPVLQQIVEKHLSEEARLVLARLAIASVPLGQPALQVLCPRPRLLKELRDASLLAAYTNRVQVLPLITSTTLQRLSEPLRREAEELVIQAYTRWLEEGDMSDREAGDVVTEAVVLLLTHHRLLQAAEVLFHYGWLSFRTGNASRLALLAEEVKKQFPWQEALESWCGGTLLHYMLTPFLGKPIDARQRAEDYRILREASFTRKVPLGAFTEIGTTHYIMLHALNELQFAEAQQVLDECCDHLSSARETDRDIHAALLERQGLLLSQWCEYAAEQEDRQMASELQERAIATYRQSIKALEAGSEQMSLCGSARKRRLAYALNYLGYHLSRVGHYEEALQALAKCLALQEQGCASFDSLPPCYGDTSQTLATLGHFQEALQFDEQALNEAERLAQLGHTVSRAERWVYHVNRGCLYLRIGRIEEAEQLLQEALPHIPAHRRMYRMFAKEALNEIEQWRLSARTSQHQLDWRWVERYRELVSYDTYWWLAPAADFTDQEQLEWERLFRAHLDEEAKKQLSTLMSRSTQREVLASIEEGREPCLRYPAADIEEVQRRIAGLLQLGAEITSEEPNAVVRRLYRDALEESVNTLRLIEATALGKTDQFKEYMQRLIPAPTREEMAYPLAFLRQELLTGLQHSETRLASERIIQILSEQCHLALDLSEGQEEASQSSEASTVSTPTQQRLVSAPAAKRFFEAVFQQSGWQRWQVEIDPGAADARIEQGLRCLFLPNHALSIGDVKYLLSHELAGHIARCLAGENSLLGLLGIHTKNSLETEEGLALYHEIQEERLRGNPKAGQRMWPGTLAVGLASGTIGSPQTFRPLFTFFDATFLLRRLARKLDPDEETARRHARQFAIARCLRTFRGVPDLTRPGICFTQDALYLRGFLTIEQAVKEDEQVLERLAVGVVAKEQLADLAELGIVRAPQPLHQLVQDPQLDAYILSFEQSETSESHTSQ